MIPKEKLHVHFRNKGNISEAGRGMGSHEDMRLLSSKYHLNNAFRHMLGFSNIRHSKTC